MDKQAWERVALYFALIWGAGAGFYWLYSEGLRAWGIVFSIVWLLGIGYYYRKLF